MTEELPVPDATSIAETQKAVLAAVRDHAGQVARELAVLHGADRGQEEFETDAGVWTLSYDAGDVDYLRFSPKSGSDRYVVSSKATAEPESLADALDDYDAFVAAFDAHVRSLEGVFDDVTTDFPPVASTAEVAAERDRLVARVRSLADEMAGQLHRSDGPYGTFATTVDGTRWELKWDGDAASYLRVGGSDGSYLLSQYEPPAIEEVVRLVPDVSAFVEAFNDHVADLEDDLSTVSLDDH